MKSVSFYLIIQESVYAEVIMLRDCSFVEEGRLKTFALDGSFCCEIS